MRIHKNSKLFLVLIIGLSFYGNCFVAVAATINSSSCSQSHVQAAVNSAADGDTVLVPAGNCTWTASVNINNKTITLTGAGSGAGGTKITHGGGNHTLISIDAGIRRGKMYVSGFWFAGSSQNWNGTAMEIDGPAGWKNVRIHHNVFDGNYPYAITAQAYTHGLIDNNTFRGSGHGIKFYGSGATDWSTPLTLGTADFFFVESNDFQPNDFYGSIGVVLVDMYGGGRVVFRYNTTIYGFFETHDKARSGQVSANAYEIYNNTFSSGGTSKWKALDISSGTGVIWGNTITGKYSVPIGAIDYKSFDPRNVSLCNGSDPADQNTPGEAGWLCQYQIGSQGSGSTAYSYPLYLWSNTYNGASTNMTCTDGCSVNGRPHLLSGRDFINNGTTAKPGYTAYTYPHPLASGNVPLAAPRNLRIIQ